MHRFYLPPESCRADYLTLTGSEAHHAAGVLRLKAGDPATVLDGAGGELACRVQTIARKEVRLEIQSRSAAPPPPWQITLVQAIPKGKMFDAIVQKSTELGAWRIVPLLSQRVTTHLEGESIEHKAAKWRQAAIEAVKQCGQRWLPQVEPPMTLPGWLARADKFDLTLVASLQDDGRELRAIFPAGAGRPETVCIWIGPEGDFAPEEMAAIKGAGALPITLGPLVLRSETAALTALAVINYELRQQGGSLAN
ncbi:MAG TPA: 16S rRNA (uracil(1498)-N(3))-methyltransferase [Verrucomicrobiae bacterium]|jgi:16S rRNA (uracil1498-N3)-methyltransferase